MPDANLQQPTLRSLERRLDRLSAKAEGYFEEYAQARAALKRAKDFLDLSPRAMGSLEELSTALFGEILDEIEVNLTYALGEILGQDRVVSTVREIKGNRLQVHFQIHNQGEAEKVEDILTGQGGSVCNILSVGLRLIALSQLDQSRHRPFLVLDEQDCWLRPSLVPRFMKMIGEICQRLDIQALVISHHPLDLFAGTADRIYSLRPSREMGAVLEKVK